MALRQFNKMKKLDPQIVDEISNYMKFKWNNDKNNFLQTHEDHSILRRVTLKNERTSVELYTKFIYRNFLKRFNRFFTLKKQTHVTYIGGCSIYEIYGQKKFREMMRETSEANQRQ